jgi:hypothetical protein
VITKRGNVAGMAPLSTLGQSWDVYDALPRRIRRALQEAGINWCAHWVSQAYGRALRNIGGVEAERLTIRVVRVADAAERQRFADDFEARLGTQYPARAAGSTLTRYERRA